MIKIGFSLATYLAKIKQLFTFLPMRAESESGHMTQAANHIHAVYNILEALGFNQHDTLHLHDNMGFFAKFLYNYFPQKQA